MIIKHDNLAKTFSVYPAVYSAVRGIIRLYCDGAVELANARFVRLATHRFLASCGSALWFHLNHGVWSSMQSLGLSNLKWLPRLKVLSTVYTTLIIGMFALVAVMFCLGYTPGDINEVMPR